MEALENKKIIKAKVVERKHNNDEILCLFLEMEDGSKFLIEDFEEISLLKLAKKINNKWKK